MHARPGVWLQPPDTVTVMEPQKQAAELIRAAIFRYLLKELPYLVSQRTIAWAELPNGELRIVQELQVPRKQSSRRIIQKRLPGIGKAARSSLCEAFGRTVHLHLTIADEAPEDL